MGCKYRIPYYLSQDCENLISNILVVNPSKRFKLQQIKSHKWIKTNSSSTYYHLFNQKLDSQQSQSPPATSAEVNNNITTTTNANTTTNTNTNAITNARNVEKKTTTTTNLNMSSSNKHRFNRISNKFKSRSLKNLSNNPRPTSRGKETTSHLSLPLYSFEQYPTKVVKTHNPAFNLLYVSNKGVLKQKKNLNFLNFFSQNNKQLNSC